MGLPVHLLGHEYQDRWIETLRRELDGYATVEAISDPDEERQSVYVVGDCGHFVLFQEPPHPYGVLLVMFPFLCSAKRYGQGMANLEERIHRALDTMSVALKPEAVERYEKSRWTRFFRLFGWEHVGSLDFAHRPKTEIVETKDDIEPPKNPCCSSCLIRIKPEFQATWPIMFKERLEGKATVRQEQGSLRTIVSPNGHYRVDTSTSIWIESAHRHYYNVQGELNGRDYRISWPFGATEEAEYGRVGRSDLDREIIRLYQEIVMNEPPTTEFMSSDKSPTRIGSLGDFRKRTRHGPKLAATWGNPCGDLFSVEKEAENGQKPFDGKSWKIAHYRRAHFWSHQNISGLKIFL